MAWDSSRPVPWLQLTRSWLIYVVIMMAVFLLFFRDRPLLGLTAGLLVSGPLYLGFGWVLAKFGYQRKTWSEMRAEREAAAEATTADDGEVVAGPRPKPPPTKRTGGGTGRPGGPRKRHR